MYDLGGTLYSYTYTHIYIHIHIHIYMCIYKCYYIGRELYFHQPPAEL